MLGRKSVSLSVREADAKKRIYELIFFCLFQEAKESDI